MADLKFDAVIAGGGNKGLMLAMYLTRYAGMTVGIFERRHEIGGGLATEETAAPGFRGNTHANIILPWYYAPLWRDFPEYWDYGGQYDQYLVSDGSIFRNNGTCLAIYSRKHDPTQERTAREIARFSERDAEKWIKASELTDSDEYLRVMIDPLFNPHEWQLAPEFMERQVAIYPKVLEAGFDPDSLVLSATPLRASREFFESPELQYCICRFIVSAARNVNDPSQGAETMGMMGTLPTIGYARGGTHQLAHAAHQVLVQEGCKFFTHAEVTKVITENGAATGICLADGTEVAAGKLVVSAGLSPAQLCLELLGKDIVGERIARRIENLTTHNIGNLMWYTYALHEAPKYHAAAFNPDINETMWLGLAEEANLEHIARECHYANMGVMPPSEEYNPVVWCHSLADPSYAPPGKHVAQNEMQGPRASDLSEKEWLKLKTRFAEDMVKIWGKFADNMNWDNIIGVDTNSPWDNVRLKNLAPDGNFSGIDQSLSQRGANRPIPELANHRTPVRNLYCTGGCWHVGSNASADAAYNCYKIIAADMGLGKPWEEPGKEEPDSLVEATREAIRKARRSFNRKG
ncbi:MAG: NAD(P)/FAD-dependent oxidoreductase [Dehalococcoidia bacterium]|nr:NAD(P)/FAD-dependent oxidoreductase [Dehalococcoidia bacterium]